MPEDWIGPDEEPQQADLDAFGEDGPTDTLPCPNCGADVYEGADRCPHCRQWITSWAPPPGPADTVTIRWWWIVLAILLAVGAVVVWLGPW